MGLYFTYCAAMLVVVMGLYAFSRGQVFGTCAVFVVLECLVLAGVYRPWRQGPMAGGKEISGVKRPSRISWRLVAADFVLVGISFFVVNYFKREGFMILPDYEKLLLLLYGLWFVCSLSTRKFEPLPYDNYYHGLWPWIKSTVLMGLSLALILFFSVYVFFKDPDIWAVAAAHGS